MLPRRHPQKVSPSLPGERRDSQAWLATLLSRFFKGSQADFNS